MGGQHPSTFDVVGDFQRVWRRIADCTGSSHLGEIRQVDIAQHQTDIRMRDKATLGVDHVGAPLSPHFDLRHDV